VWDPYTTMDTLFDKKAESLVQKRVTHIVITALKSLIKKVKNEMKIGRGVKTYPSITLVLHLINVSVSREFYCKFNLDCRRN
jgi:hypothetical protein